MDGALIAAAVLITPSPILQGRGDLIKITGIDGKPAHFLENRAVVSVGTHTVDLLIELRRASPDDKDKSLVTKIDTSLTLTVQPGREYRIEAREDARGVWVWAADTGNNEVVAGSRPDLP